MTKVTSNSNPVNSTKGPWLGVNGRLWRHTIGRVSSGVRAPINFLAAIGQGLKIFGKTLALPVTYTITGIHSLVTKDSKSYQGSFSLRGIAVDAVGFAGLLKNVGICFMNTIVAPSVKSHDFCKGLQGTLKVLRGDLQDLQTSKLCSVSDIYKAVVTKKEVPKKAPFVQSKKPSMNIEDLFTKVLHT